MQDRERRILNSTKTVEAQRRAFAASGVRAFTSQPDFLKGVCVDGWVVFFCFGWFTQTANWLDGFLLGRPELDGVQLAPPDPFLSTHTHTHTQTQNCVYRRNAA